MPDGSALTKPANLSPAPPWPGQGSAALAFGVLPAYRRFELRQARYMDMVPAVEQLARERGHLRILDIGSGTGSAKQFLDHAGIGAKWTAIEIDPRRATRCRRLGYHNVVEAHNLEKADLPFPDRSFDVVIASHIMEHLRDDSGALADWYRVLAPGGRLLLGVPMHLKAVASLARWKYGRVGRKPFGHCQFYSLASLQRLLQGYPVETIRGFRLFSARKWLPFEDFEWFYRVSVRFGARWPGLTQEVNAEIVKPAE